jgi:hypothetical protein
MLHDYGMIMAMALLTDKDTDTYIQVLNEIKVRAAFLGLNLDPKLIYILRKANTRYLI